MISPKGVFEIGSEQITKTDGDAFRIDWKVPEGLPYFDGHFPGNPVLPAVAIVDASVEFLRRVRAEAGLQLKGVNSAKFVAVIAPNMDVHISLRPTKGQQQWEAVWNSTGTNGETPRLLAELSFNV